MSPLAQALVASPDLFPAALELRSEAVTLWRLSREDYGRSAFLDGRIAAGKQSRQLPFAALVAAVEETDLEENCDFIFHMGHVGSTLLSRLLGNHPALFSLREPDILRTLATIEKTRRDAYLSPLLQLWSRTYEPGARALVKATSFVSGIATEILARPSRPRALIVGVPPEVYLATIFAGANAPGEARALAPMRLARLRKYLGPSWPADHLRVGETVAMGWLCETLSLVEAVQADSAGVLTLSFDQFLADPRKLLARVFAHFDVVVEESQIAKFLAGPEMKSYSKAPEFYYDSASRRALLDQARNQFSAEIRAGLLWLDRQAGRLPFFQAALTLFETSP